MPSTSPSDEPDAISSENDLPVSSCSESDTFVPSLASSVIMPLRYVVALAVLMPCFVSTT